MSQKLSIIWNYLAHYKYLIVIIAGVLIVGVVDDNSIRQHIKYQLQIATLREEIGKYREQYEKDSRQLKEMRQGPDVFGKIARERYFMKSDDEDIFVLSTDLPDEVVPQDDAAELQTENSENAD